MNGINLSGKPGMVHRYRCRNIGAPTYTSYPTTLANITLDNRSPTAQFDDALNIAVLGGEFGLLVVAAPVTPFMDGLTK